MNKLLFIILTFAASLVTVGVSGEALAESRQEDSVKTERSKNIFRRKSPTFLSVKFGGGQVFQTNDFVSGDRKIPLYKAASLKFAIASAGDRWQDIAYRMPYYGIGVYAVDFDRRNDFGIPVSIFIFQGANFVRASKRLHFNYELNLGASFGWKHYEPFTNPENIAVGTSINAHIGLMVYMKWLATKHMDLNIGAELTHSSNGAVRMPNKGMNLGGLFVEAVYNFNGGEREQKYNPTLRPPQHDKHWASDFLVNVSSRQETVSNKDTGRPTEYIDRKFAVFGLSYALMRVPNYHYRYGLSADMIYDESSGVRAWRQEKDGQWYDRVKKGNFGERIAFGLSAKGEITSQGYSVFANIGYDIIHGNKADHRLYQVVGVKIYLKENFFGTFGIRATHFSSAQFLYWSLGYTLDHSPRAKRHSGPR